MVKRENLFMRYVVMKEGTQRPKFTIRWVTFDTKRALSGDEAKDLIRKDMKKSKKLLQEEYDVIYGRAQVVGRGASLRTDYSIVVKPFANTIFVFPKAHRKEARKVISELSVKGKYTLK